MLPTSFARALLLVLAVGGLAAAPVPAAGPYRPEWASLDQRPMPAWFQDAKFGIFIHWGVYSVPAWAVKGEYAEWYWNRIMRTDAEHEPWRAFHRENFGEDFDYADFAPQFRAELFDARQWAEVFERAGAKYVVPTSKHHDGYALWPSADASRTWGRPWNAAEVGPQRDLMGELAAAVRERGLKFGFYYSLYEWFNPLWRSDRSRYVSEHMIPQFKDVVNRYDPAIIFSDGEWDMPSADWRSEELLAWLFNESAVKDEVVVNDRWGKETRHRHGGYWTTEYTAGLQDGSHPWEESRGMAYSYGLSRAERAEDYKSARELILVLVDLVSRGGNLLLDIGPAADGTIPPIMEERLLEMGDWLRINGEAIYGTRFAGRSCQWTEGEQPKQEYGEYRVKYELLDQVGQVSRDGRAVKQVFFTQKPDALYAITAGWPGRQLTLRDVTLPAHGRVTMLGVPGDLAVQVTGPDLVITLPDFGPEEAPGRYAYTLKLAGGKIAPGQSGN
jgi:alpha-L-fucosidase